MNRGLVALLALGACDFVFQIDRVPLRDAAIDVGCGSPDEDGDCHGDEADNCPGITNVSQANDLDGSDGLGDVCDPDPALPGDRLELFFGFNDPAADMQQWTVPSGAYWEFSAGMVAHTRLDDTFGQLRYASERTDANLTVEAGFTFRAWNAAGVNPRIGVLVDLGASSHSCWVRPDPGNATRDDAYHQDYTDVHTRAANVAKLAAGDTIVISFHRQLSPPRLRCRVTINGDGVDVPEISPGTIAWPSGGPFGAITREAAAELRYLAVYAGP